MVIPNALAGIINRLTTEKQAPRTEHPRGLESPSSRYLILSNHSEGMIASVRHVVEIRHLLGLESLISCYLIFLLPKVVYLPVRKTLLELDNSMGLDYPHADI
jgi:hypothetical protein